MVILVPAGKQDGSQSPTHSPLLGGRGSPCVVGSSAWSGIIAFVFTVCLSLTKLVPIKVAAPINAITPKITIVPIAP